MKLQDCVKIIDTGQYGRLIEICNNDYVIKVDNKLIVTFLQNLCRLPSLGDIVHVKDILNVGKGARNKDCKIIGISLTEKYGYLYVVTCDNLKFLCYENDFEWK